MHELINWARNGNREQPVYQQYHRLLEILKYKATPDADDGLTAATHYHFLQDRVEEGIRFFEKIDRQAIDEKLQYDYLASYVPSTKGDVAGAKKLASKYADYPVERWRKRFASVSAQVKEIERGCTRGHRRGKPRAKDRELGGHRACLRFRGREGRGDDQLP